MLLAVYGIAIHGGAGTIDRSNLSAEQEKAYRATLEQALRAGYRVLESNGTAVDAVEAAIVLMEDSPLFNAGRGAVFTHDGHNEMDASIMDGRTTEAGAVAGVRTVRNPIRAARKVMTDSPHVLLSGQGADQFAKSQGLAIETPAYFRTERRWKQLERIRDSKGTELDHGSKKKGTVGAVALDRHGNLAAGTSTGGMTNKRWGRIGDSPIIGAGTYARNATAAVSCTGHGEYFIREAVAASVSARMELAGQSVQAASDAIIHGRLKTMGCSGGLVAMDGQGNVAMPFNTGGMYRGYLRSDGQLVVHIWAE